MHAGTARVMLALDEMKNMSNWSFHNNRFFINDSGYEPSHNSYSIRRAIPKCYEFGDIRKGNN